jgi:hypothetical protein
MMSGSYTKYILRECDGIGSGMLSKIFLVCLVIYMKRKDFEVLFPVKIIKLLP